MINQLLIKTVVLLLFMAIACRGGDSLSASAGLNGHSEMADEEYILYSIILEEFISEETGIIHAIPGKTAVPWPGNITTLVIEDHTTVKGEAIGTLESYLELVNEKIKMLKPETLSDYRDKAQNTLPLNVNRFSVRIPCRLIGSHDPYNFMGNNCRHDLSEFYGTRYPKSQGIMRLSRVAFDKSRSQGLVYMENTKAAMWGIGHFFFLQKNQSGTWVIMNKVLAYQS